MKALVFNRYGGPDQVALADIPRPAFKPDELLVQVHAAGLNPIDNMIPKGTFKPILMFELPATLGSDLAGQWSRSEVESPGSNRAMLCSPASSTSAQAALSPNLPAMPESVAAHKRETWTSCKPRRSQWSR